MGRTGRVFVRPLIIVVAAGLSIAASSNSALSNDNCRYLEDLARQYAGVQLTSEQKQLKRKLVAWYNGNCKRQFSAEARR
jgi:hypothetical protein